jgi:hypothetical protein
MTNATSNMREYKRLWAAKRRADFMQGKSCVVCGTTQSLEVDHIDPTQKVSHRIWTWAIARRDAELAKCQILCTEHHKEKTRADRPIPEHGTISRYGGAHKCRCDLCRKANAERKKLNEAKKKIADARQAIYDLDQLAA